MIEALSPTSLVLGDDVRVDLLDAGRLRLDGGAVYRVVPKPLWERDTPADAANRVELAMHPLLIRAGGQTLLVDCGIGPERRDAKLIEQCAIQPGPGLEAELARVGAAPADVDQVVLTHLHFDHGGGLLDAGGQPRFPNARVVAQRLELEDSSEDCALCRASYRSEDYALLRERDRFQLLDGDADLAPGVRAVVTGGHTRAHQAVFVEAGGETLVCWGDLIPTRFHLRPHYVLGFDLYPRQSWEQKQAWMPRAVEEGWIHVLYHELEHPLGRAVPEGRGYRIVPVA